MNEKNVYIKYKINTQEQTGRIKNTQIDINRMKGKTKKLIKKGKGLAMNEGKGKGV